MIRRLLPAAALLLLVIALPDRSRAQSIVAELHLGGDSTQAAVVALNAHEVYRLEVTPARARVQLHLRARFPEPPLDQRPVTDRQPPEGGAVLAVVPARAGEYIVELTNPGVGATHVRIVSEMEGAVPTGAAAAALEPEATILEEMYPGPAYVVVLVEGTAYRIELSPPAAAEHAQIYIRSARNTGGPPIPLYPMTGGQGFILLPTSTGEYRVDVAADEPVRVRISSDPKETARWVRIADATRNLPSAGLAVRALVIGAFPTSGSTDSTAGGVGMDFCLGSVPRGGWTGGPIGGCALNLAYYARAQNSGVFVLSIAPRFVLSRADEAAQISLGVSAGIGGTTQGAHNQSYWMFSAGLVVERPMSRRWVLELEGDLVWATTAGQTVNRSSTPLRAAVGVQYRP